jgi:hypothetical protein
MPREGLLHLTRLLLLGPIIASSSSIIFCSWVLAATSIRSRVTIDFSIFYSIEIKTETK